MLAIKIGKRRQLMLPVEICNEVNISEGDYLWVSIREGEIVMKPNVLIEEDIVAYWKERLDNEDGVLELSEEGKERLEIALKDEEEGRYEEFDNVEDLIKDLKE